jgi:translation initiation factor IF-2
MKQPYKKKPTIINVKPKEKKAVITKFSYSSDLSISDLSKLINHSSGEILKYFFVKGVDVNVNSSLTDEQVLEISLEYDIEATRVLGDDEIDWEQNNIIDDPKDLVVRPPVVTIMGHVDHGKTTLLDYIRRSRVTESEFGGITQKIGAYQVDYKGHKISFIDTPGHEAFTSMRARGSAITDMAIIVVAADDGVMPQTKEAISHARAAKIPFIIAANKIDRAGNDLEKLKSELSKNDIIIEDWGGDVMFVPISAKTGKGVDTLLESILLLAEVKDLKANPKRLPMGTVIGAKLDKGLGVVANVLVQNGTLHTGDPIVMGSCFGRVRQMKDDLNHLIKLALPSTPVEITGLSELPEAGDRFVGFKDEKLARALAEKQRIRKVQQDRRTARVSLEDVHKQLEEGQINNFNVVIKSDIQGSAEAVKSSLEKINIEGVRIDVIHFQSGAITESDIALASASKALIFGFNVFPDSNIKKKAQEENVEIKTYKIIYDLVDDVTKAMKGTLKPVLSENVIGEVEVRQIITISKMSIAGCIVKDGVVKNNSRVRLLRDGILVYETKISSLKRMKNDAKEVRQGFECGLTLENFSDFKEGDILEIYEIKESAVI